VTSTPAPAAAASAVLAFVAGLAAGVVGTVAHSVVLPLAGLDLPLGLLVACLLVAAVQGFVVAASGSRLVPVVGVLGWGLALLVGVLDGPGGDRLLSRPPTAAATAWLVCGALALVLATRASRRAAGTGAR
jgi:hypothetical protein